MRRRAFEMDREEFFAEYAPGPESPTKLAELYGKKSELDEVIAKLEEMYTPDLTTKDKEVLGWILSIGYTLRWMRDYKGGRA